MSISTTSTKDSYDGNASIATAYPITFKYLEDTHVSVYFDGVLKQRGAGADYVLAGDGTINTGYITTNVAQPATVKVTIVLDVPFDQPVELLETGVLSANTLEEAYDRLNMQIRRVWRKVGGVLTFSSDEGGTGSTGTADNLLGFDGSGDIAEIPNSTFVQTANNLSDVDAATARANLNVDVANTDNSTDVTKTGAGTYISIGAGQVLTVDAITESDVSDLGAYIENVTGSPLSELQDVTITTPSSSQVLAWNGSAWVNTSASTGDMQAATYDNTGKALNVYSMDNMDEGANTKILTDSERTLIGSALQSLPLSGLSDATITSVAVGETIEWNGSAWVNTVSGATVTSSDTAPVSPDDGDLWFDSTTTQLFVYYNDGSSSQWVTVTSGSPSTDSDTVTYTPDGTGAVATTVENKLRESVSVKDFGAVGDGVADDTTAIQAAIDYAGTFAISGGASQADKNLYNRCTVFIPSGRYKVTSKITINSAGVHIKGAGIFGTQIEYTHNDDLFHFRSDDQFTTGRLHNVGVSEMSILGKYSNPTTGGSIRVGYVKHVYINDVKFNGGYDDIILEGTQEPVHIDRCDFFQDNNYTAQGTGNAHVKVRELEVDPTSANSMRVTSDSKHWAYSVNVNISQCEMRTATNGKQYGIYVKAVDGLYLSDTHLLNHSEQLFVGRASNVFPCSNIRVSNCFFDGESPNTLRNINVTSAEAAGATAPVDLYISDCKFNGVGDGGASPEYWMLISDKSIKHLSVSGCVFDKAQNATAAAIEISKGSGSCVLSNNTFIMEDSYVPAVIIRTNASNVVQADFFEKLIISGNRFIYQDTTDRANYNIRLANAQTETVIANNIYSDSLSGTDKLVYDTTTSGTTQGGAGTLNNISIA